VERKLLGLHAKFDWKGDEGTHRELASRLTGSSDLYQQDGKRPYASINFIAAHDGFTLHDLVTYNEKQNEANGENNRDGDSHNNSWNCGVEGPIDDEQVNALRRRQMRNFLATLFLSQGVPMLAGGDEFARTQKGNNNVYCQDNELSWFSWERRLRRRRRLSSSPGSSASEKNIPSFADRSFGRPIRGSEIKDVMWLNPSGKEMSDAEWNSGYARSIGLLLSGQTMDVRDSRGELITDDTFVPFFNAHHENSLSLAKDPDELRMGARSRHSAESDSSMKSSLSHDCPELIERSLVILRHGLTRLKPPAPQETEPSERRRPSANSHLHLSAVIPSPGSPSTIPGRSSTTFGTRISDIYARPTFSFAREHTWLRRRGSQSAETAGRRRGS
jgi:glycogen operon protein